MMFRYAFAGMLLLAAACGVPDPNGPDPLLPGKGDEGPQVKPQPVLQRERRRMDVDQLDAALASVTGGLHWMKGSTNQLVALSETLGKPDYIEVTQEDMGTTSLFLKFLDDGARSICADLITAEGSRTERAFVTPASFDDAPGSVAVNATLERAVLRFHGRKVDAAGLTAWSGLFSGLVAADTAARPAASATDHHKAAWNGVCIALITHAEFYTY